MKKNNREMRLQKVRRYRALGSLCRQQAAYNPSQRWRLLAEAEYWEHMAAVEMTSHFEECNTMRSSDLAQSGIPLNGDETRWEPVGAA
jgi:hypothetical protein